MDSEIIECPHTLENVLEQKTLRWVFVGGKGGVGKTTTACSLALRAAQVRKSVLLVSTDPAHNVSDALDQKIGSRPTPVNGVPNMAAMEIDPAEEIRESAKAKDMGKVNSLLEQLGDYVGGGGSIPGMDELLAFQHVLSLVQEAEYDLVIFDTAPTGHTLRFLSLPDTARTTIKKVTEMFTSAKSFIAPIISSLGLSEDSMKSLLGSTDGILKDIEEISKQFKDPNLTTFICVAIPEFLALYETERLVQQLARLEIDTHNVVVNFVIDANEETQCPLCRARARMQMKYINQFQALYDDFSLVFSPLREDEVRGQKALLSYSETLMKPYNFCWLK